MIGISKSMLGAAALVAFGLVTLDDMAKGWAEQAQSVDQRRNSVSGDSAARERALDTLRTLAAQQRASRAAGEAAASPKCRGQSWPYYSNDCLVHRDGTAVVPAARVVRIDVRADGPVQMARLQ